MGEVVPVVAGGVEFYAEVEAADGPANVGLDEVLSFDGVRQTVEAISGELVSAWRAVRPDEASVEFALTLKAKEGKLTGLLVSGGAQGSLKVILKWRNRDPDVPTAEGSDVDGA
jgi:hypothetical protein